MKRSVLLAMAILIPMVTTTAFVAPSSRLAASHEYYPMHSVATWTYESSARGRFVNEITESSTTEAGAICRVRTTEAAGRTQSLHVRRDGGRIYQRAGAGDEMLLVDFDVPLNGSFRADRMGHRALHGSDDSFSITGAKNEFVIVATLRDRRYPFGIRQEGSVRRSCRELPSGLGSLSASRAPTSPSPTTTKLTPGSRPGRLGGVFPE